MSELTNDFVREELQEYLLNKGVKQTFIALHTGLSDCSVSKFLRKERQLNNIYLKKIYELISE